MPDEDFYLHAGHVLFPVNKHTIPAGVPFLEELSSNIIPSLRRDSVNLLRIWVSGAASPEGPYLNNVRLSKERAKSLSEFLNRQFGGSMDASIVVAKDDDVESFRALLWLMRCASDPAYDEVSQLFDTYLTTGNNDKLKRKLMALHGGSLWRRFLRDYFPQLRAARIMLWCRKPVVSADSACKPDSILSPPSSVDALVEESKEETDSSFTPQEEPSPSVSVIPRRECLSVKTNLLLDVAWMPGYNRWCPIPNIAVEYYPRHGHFTYGASLDVPWWRHYDKHKFFEARNYQLESRYYFKKDSGANGAYEANGAYGGVYRGFYLQGYVHANLFEIGFNADKGWEGEGWGAGLGAGYVLPVSHSGHWRLELGLQAGWFTCRYDPFQYENLINPNYHDGLYYYHWTGDADDFRKRQHRLNWLGPTRVGVTLSYDLLYRRRQKGGVSFRPTEERRVAP